MKASFFSLRSLVIEGQVTHVDIMVVRTFPDIPGRKQNQGVQLPAQLLKHFLPQQRGLKFQSSVSSLPLL